MKIIVLAFAKDWKIVWHSRRSNREIVDHQPWEFERTDPRRFKRLLDQFAESGDDRLNVVFLGDPLPEFNDLRVASIYRLENPEIGYLCVIHSATPGVFDLSARELDVFQAVANGALAAADLASSFNISISTAKNHITAISRKLEVSGVKGVIAEAFRGFSHTSQIERGFDFRS